MNNVPIRDKLKGGRGKSVVNSLDTISVVTPLVFAPNSIEPEYLQLNDEHQIDNIGHEVNNLGGSHAILQSFVDNDITNKDFDYLNGARVVEKLDPQGVPMIGYDDPSLPTINNRYFSGTGQYGYVAVLPESTTTPESVDLGIAAPILSVPVTDNFLMWINCFIPKDEVYTGVIDNVGFDMGGALRTTALGAGEDTNGSFSMSMKGGFAVNTNVAGSTADQHYGFDNEGQVTTINYGRATALFVVNANDCQFLRFKGLDDDEMTGFGFNVVQSGIDDVLFVNALAAATGWTAMRDPVMLNLGQGASPEFGVYSMGIKNFDTSVPLSEAYEAGKFMQQNGLLPPWW